MHHRETERERAREAERRKGRDAQEGRKQYLCIPLSRDPESQKRSERTVETPREPFFLFHLLRRCPFIALTSTFFLASTFFSLQQHKKQNKKKNWGLLTASTINKNSAIGFFFASLFLLISHARDPTRSSERMRAAAVLSHQRGTAGRNLMFFAALTPSARESD